MPLAWLFDMVALEIMHGPGSFFKITTTKLTTEIIGVAFTGVVFLSCSIFRFSGMGDNLNILLHRRRYLYP